MKFLVLAIMSLGLMSCGSSPKEEHQERQEEATADYKESLKRSNDQYKKEMLKEHKEEAQEMIENAESLDLEKTTDKINVDD